MPMGKKITDAAPTDGWAKITPVDKMLMEAAEENGELTERQKLFCLHYIRTFNGAAAARRAGYAPGYADRYAYTLLHKPKIKAEVRRLKKLRTAAGLMADKQDVVGMYMRIAFADMTDFVEFGTETPEEETGDAAAGKRRARGTGFARLKNSAEVDGTLLVEVKEGRDGVSFKLADRMKALEFLAGYFELDPQAARKADFDRRRLELEEMRAAEGGGEGTVTVVDDLG